MKIIHIIPGKANPNTLNGVNKVVHCLAEEQIKNNKEVIVCGIANNVIKRHESNYPLILFKKSRIKFLAPIKLLKFVIKNGENSLFHLHSAYIIWHPLFVIFLKILGYKYVVTPHGGYNINKFKASIWKVFYFYFIESIILILATKIQILGKSELNRITRLFLKRKSILIPNGCYTKPQFKKDNNSLELTFGFMGRLQIDHKGLDLLLNGFAFYLREGGIGRLLLVGDGPDSEELRSLVKQLNIGAYVEFLGVKFKNDKDNFLKGISYFVHTSRWEGFPMSCIEAASYGTPLLISNETNMGEIVSQYNSGYVLESNTPKEIEKGLFFLEKQYFSVNYNLLLEGVEKMILSELSWKEINSKIEKALYIP